jgi:ribosomal protein S10
MFVCRPQKDWKELGLKYDPDTLPVVQTLDPNLAPFTEEDYAMTLIHGRSVHKPFFHPRTHDIPVANIHFRSHHVRFLNLFTHFASHAASALGIPASQVVALPTQRRLWTVLRSPFAHKKSQENFERKVHKRAIKAWDAHPQVVQRWITYLRTHAMPGVGMKVITWERAPLGIGASHLKKEARGQVLTPSKKIEALGKKIVVEETVSEMPTQQQA